MVRVPSTLAHTVLSGVSGHSPWLVTIALVQSFVSRVAVTVLIMTPHTYHHTFLTEVVVKLMCMNPLMCATYVANLLLGTVPMLWRDLAPFSHLWF